MPVWHLTYTSYMKKFDGNTRKEVEIFESHEKCQ
jgi:hypothetical protein